MQPICVRVCACVITIQIWTTRLHKHENTVDGAKKKTTKIDTITQKRCVGLNDDRWSSSHEKSTSKNINRTRISKIHKNEKLTRSERCVRAYVCVSMYAFRFCVFFRERTCLNNRTKGTTGNVRQRRYRREPTKSKNAFTTWRARLWGQAGDVVRRRPNRSLLTTDTTNARQRLYYVCTYIV